MSKKKSLRSSRHKAKNQNQKIKTNARIATRRKNNEKREERVVRDCIVEIVTGTSLCYLSKDGSTVTNKREAKRFTAYQALKRMKNFVRKNSSGKLDYKNANAMLESDRVIGRVLPAS